MFFSTAVLNGVGKVKAMAGVGVGIGLFSGRIDEHPDVIAAQQRLNALRAKQKELAGLQQDLRQNLDQYRRAAADAVIRGDVVVDPGVRIETIERELQTFDVAIKQAEGDWAESRRTAQREITKNLKPKYARNAETVLAALAELEAAIKTAEATEAEAERRGSEIGGISHPITEQFEDWRKSLQQIVRDGEQAAG